MWEVWEVWVVFLFNYIIIHMREVSGARLLLVVPETFAGIGFLAARAAAVANAVKS